MQPKPLLCPTSMMVGSDQAARGGAIHTSSSTEVVAVAWTNAAYVLLHLLKKRCGWTASANRVRRCLLTQRVSKQWLGSIEAGHACTGDCRRQSGGASLAHQEQAISALCMLRQDCTALETATPAGYELCARTKAVSQNCASAPTRDAKCLDTSLKCNNQWLEASI